MSLQHETMVGDPCDAINFIVTRSNQMPHTRWMKNVRVHFEERWASPPASRGELDNVEEYRYFSHYNWWKFYPWSLPTTTTVDVVVRTADTVKHDEYHVSRVLVWQPPLRLGEIGTQSHNDGPPQSIPRKLDTWWKEYRDMACNDAECHEFPTWVPELANK